MMGDKALTTAPHGPYGGPGGFVQLPDGDKQRMARLYEEVQGRLRAMSLIVARNLGMDFRAHQGHVAASDRRHRPVGHA
jgi:hypothetical protein